VSSREWIWVGAGVRLTVSFTDPDSDAPVPVEEPVLITVESPAGGTEELPDVGEVSEGVYAGVMIVDAAGTWRFRAESGGDMPGVDEGSFEVHPTYLSED
jgi:hypothetical protein